MLISVGLFNGVFSLFLFASFFSDRFLMQNPVKVAMNLESTAAAAAKMKNKRI